MSIISYAQNLEDVLLWRTLGHVTEGFYIDIGGMSPDEHSVTKLFYDAGWSGINVDPIPENIRKFMEKRPRDINLECAVSDSIGVMTIFNVKGTGLSTFETEFADNAEKLGFRADAQTTPTVTLESLWNEHVASDRDVHFLKIDVEGHEHQAIKGGNWNLHRPWVLVVEATKPLSQEANFRDWDSILLGQDYLFCWFDGLNRYYVAREHEELASSLNVQPNVFDNFTIAEVVNLRAQLGEVNRFSQLRRKPIWKFFFRRGGSPRLITRRILTNSHGEVRPLMSSFAFRADGSAKSPFSAWFKKEGIQKRTI